MVIENITILLHFLLENENQVLMLLPSKEFMLQACPIHAWKNQYENIWIQKTSSPLQLPNSSEVFNY
jgi:hypothetical protein